MKFVCTECDEPMKFDHNGGLDEDGSLLPPSAALAVSGA